MPQKEPNKPGVKFNPSLGGAFENSAFGEGSVLLNVTEENLNTLMQNIRVGSSILFRFNKVTQKGNKHYFVEILPPMQPKTANAASKGKSTSSID